MARTPITNAQYQLYVEARGAAPPRFWVDGQPPKDALSYPVVDVSWYDACAYCQWLSQVIGKHVRLPTEAEWEKAARGARDRRIYPWGDQFDALKCNSRELDFRETFPVGIFLAGASPYGGLDMAGNVWEWTSSRFASYSYDPSDGREIVDESNAMFRVLRGGAFWAVHQDVRCAGRSRRGARLVLNLIGVRVVLVAGLP